MMNLLRWSYEIAVIVCIIIPICKTGGRDIWKVMELVRFQFSWREK